MSSRKIIWLPRVKRKIVQYRSVRFTPDETYDFIAETILEVEVLLSNPILSRSYIEEMGERISQILYSVTYLNSKGRLSGKAKLILEHKRITLTDIGDILGTKSYIKHPKRSE
jgi:hypothetical protein